VAWEEAGSRLKPHDAWLELVHHALHCRAVVVAAVRARLVHFQSATAALGDPRPRLARMVKLAFELARNFGGRAKHQLA